MTMAKLTVGFKGPPELKRELIEEARTCGITVSEYLEYVVSNRNRPMLPEEIQEAKKALDLERTEYQARELMLELRIAELHRELNELKEPLTPKA